MIESITIIIFPIILILFYTFFLIIKPPSVSDKFFHLSKTLKKETIIERIKILQKINNCDYSNDISQVERFYSDGKISEREEGQIEAVITNSYFNGFTSKWIAFKKADIVLKFIFILSFIYAFFYLNLVFITLLKESETDFVYMIVILAAINLSLIIPYLFALTLFGCFSVLISFLNIFLYNVGGVSRTAVISEELIKALKPGGRSTRIVLGRPDVSDWARAARNF